MQRKLTHGLVIDENRIHRTNGGRRVDRRCLGDEERFRSRSNKCPAECIIETHNIRRFTKTEPVSCASATIDADVFYGLDQCDVRAGA
jgi:hypothetical protein